MGRRIGNEIGRPSGPDEERKGGGGEGGSQVYIRRDVQGYRMRGGGEREGGGGKE